MQSLYSACQESIKVDVLFGVSAGIVNGINYISGQKGRSLKVNTDYIKDKRYYIDLLVIILPVVSVLVFLEFLHNVLLRKHT